MLFLLNCWFVELFGVLVMVRRLLCLVGVCVMVAVAQEQTAPQGQVTLRPAPQQERPPVALDVEPYFGVGFQLGFLSGVGFQFRYTTPRRYALELNAGYITAGKNRSWYSVGAEFQYQFDNSLDSRFYGLVGLGYYADDKETGNALSHPTRFGVGVGYEWFISRAAAISLEAPVTVFIPAESDRNIQVYPTAQIGIVYYFR